MDIHEKLRRLRELGYDVQDRIARRPVTGEAVLYVNGQDIDEQFVDQLVLGANFGEVQIRRDRWLEGR